MATLYISEYDRMPTDGLGIASMGKEPAIATQTVAIGVASAQSNAFNSKTKFIRLHTDAICSVQFGSNPTATASHARMPAGQTEFFGVEGGHKVAVITNT